MYHIFKKLISQDDCNYFNSIALDYKQKNKLQNEGKDNSFYNNSFGTAQIPEFESLLHKLTPIVKDTLKIKHITAENSYTRIYYNGSTLGKHVDREGLDITMSLCTFTNLPSPWPLYFETLDKNVITAKLEVGDAAAILGTRMTHWRDPLVCSNEHYIIMSFYHWRIHERISFL